MNAARLAAVGLFTQIVSHQGKSQGKLSTGLHKIMDLLLFLRYRFWRECTEEKVHDLVRAVGQLPLALTLMGNYLRKQTYSGQSRRIHTALQRLSDAKVRLS